MTPSPNPVSEPTYRITSKAIHQNISDARQLLEIHDFNLMSPDDGMFLAQMMVDITHLLDRILERVENK